jgi:diguanylate cyclase (GGDEF)-like protein
MEDITDRKNAEEAKRESEMLAAQVLDATSDAVLVLNAQLEIIFYNSTAQKLCGDRINNDRETLHHLLQIRKNNALIHAILSSYKSQNARNIEFFWKPADIWLDVHVRPDSERISLFMRDVSDQKRAQRQLQYAARHDALTGAPNRVVLFDQLASHLKTSVRSGHIALMCLDLDFFKEVNDTLGHPAGDTVLKLVVNRLRSCIRSNDLLARTGGDEFMILQTGVHSRHDVELLVERVVSTMKNPFHIEGREVQIGVSIGIALSDGDQQNSVEIYKQADLALYAVKYNNRGGFQFFEPAMDKEVRITREFRSDLAGALLRHELSVVFQPIVRTMDETIVGAEALLRWNHPDRGDVSPAQFIPLAEESGYIIESGEWVLQESCRAAQAWPDHMMLSVNVSPKQFERSNFNQIVARALEVSGFPPDRLILEVTESVFFSTTDIVTKTISELTSHGIRMVLDDFGTGYSSLGYLDTFEFRKLKIDRSFVSKIESATQPMPILDAIMGLAHGLGLAVTAEGVETRTQFEYLRKIKCHEVQGYLFGKPMSENELIGLMVPNKGMITMA